MVPLEASPPSPNKPCLHKSGSRVALGDVTIHLQSCPEGRGERSSPSTAAREGPSQLALTKHVLLKSEDTLSLWKKTHPAGVSMPQALGEASATHLQKAESQGPRNLQKLAKPAVFFYFITFLFFLVEHLQSLRF